MAEKHSQLLIDALSRAAAEPAGMPLFGTRAAQGLFPSTAAARPVAARALDEKLLRIVRTESRGKQTREFVCATDEGLRFLLDQVSPKQVLEDFVRALERREGEVAELLGTAHQMAETLEGLKAAVEIVLPQVQAARITVPSAGSPDINPSVEPGDFDPATRTMPHRIGVTSMNGVATLEVPPAVEAADDLDAAILARLADWSASAAAGQDCPLPELYRSLSTRETPPTIGAFHDSLRALVADRRVYLHPWTGPLYALPEPAYALLVGHNIAYYASARS